MQASKTEPGKNWKYEQTNHKYLNVILKSPNKESLGPDGFTGKFSQNLVKRYHLPFWNYSKELQRKEHSQVHSTKLPITLISKPYKDSTSKKKKEKRKL